MNYSTKFALAWFVNFLFLFSFNPSALAEGIIKLRYEDGKGGVTYVAGWKFYFLPKEGEALENAYGKAVWVLDVNGQEIKKYIKAEVIDELRKTGTKNVVIYLKGREIRFVEIIEVDRPQ